MKITQRQLSGYKKAKREWIGFNDAYNMATFGIDKATYSVIAKAEKDAIGIMGGDATLQQINKTLSN